MDKKLEMKIRKLGPIPRRVLEYVITSGPAPSSAATISTLNLGDNETGGGYSVLVRNDLVLPRGRDERGSILWESADEIVENEEEVLGLIKKLNEKK